MTDLLATLTMDHDALKVLVNATFQNEWFEKFALPAEAGELKRVVLGNRVYILSRQADEYSRFLVVRIGDQGVFSGIPSPRHLFDRIVHVALANFEKTTLIPVKWRPYNEGSLLSLYAQPETIGPAHRAYFDRSPAGTQNVYAYAATEHTEDFDSVERDMAAFNDASDKYLDAVLQPPPAKHDSQAFGITLSGPLSLTIIGAGTLKDWYETKLTREQRAFVDRDHKAPVRLKGPAGSGKTLAMAVKCLQDTYKLEDASKPSRVAFVTHSSALAHDVLPGIFYGLDPTARWTSLRYCKLLMGSLYEFAQELLQYERKELKPLSLDGKEGRDFQAMLIEDAIKEKLSNTRFCLSIVSKCSREFAELLKDGDGRISLVNDLMNEFACVIDADGIRLGSALAEKYLKADREQWQMNLPTDVERLAVLEIHESYATSLEKSRVLSMDQMIADFNKYLLTHEWRQLRERQGFDLVFVDEFHYFNNPERMTFHNLFRPAAHESGRLPLFMAYDLKQSPNDALINYKRQENVGNVFKSVRAGETELVELTAVFRHSPQIVSFLRDLDGSFPAFDLEGEWSGYSGESKLAPGDVPTLSIYKSDIALVDDIFARAWKLAGSIGGKNTAVLCMNDILFGKYIKYGRISGRFIALSGRDELHELRYAGKRCVFSMPEYVAGLQFEAVFLIHVDRSEVMGANDSLGARRRFVSRCYLGASRATKRLEIASSLERGGKADILGGPLQSGSIIVDNKD